MATTPLSDSQTLIDQRIAASATFGSNSTGTNGTFTAWEQVALDKRIQFIANVGTFSGASNGISFQVLQATDTNGANVVPIVGLSVTGQTNTGSYVFDVRGQDLISNPSGSTPAYSTVALQITGSATGSASLAIVVLGDPEVTPPTSVANQVIFLS